jgi:hypothetical protein
MSSDDCFQQHRQADSSSDSYVFVCIEYRDRIDHAITLNIFLTRTNCVQSMIIDTNGTYNLQRSRQA